MPREIRALRPRPPNVGSGLQVLGSVGSVHAKALARPLSPALGSVEAAGDQPGLGMARDSRQLSKFEGERRAKKTGLCCCLCRAPALKVLGIRDLVLYARAVRHTLNSPVMTYADLGLRKM